MAPPRTIDPLRALPERLRELLVEGVVVLVLGRCSTATGGKAIRLAIQSWDNAADEVEKLGLPRPTLPPNAAELLANAPVHASVTRQGTRFQNRWIVDDSLLDRHGIVSCVSIGTAHEVDDEYTQPWAEQQAHLIDRYDVRVEVAADAARISRCTWGVHRPMMELHQRRGYVVTRRKIYETWGRDANALQQDVREADEEAEDLVFKTRTGMIKRTQNRMVDGMVNFHCSHPAPPGLCRFEMKDGRKLVVLDSPTIYGPIARRVARGMPEHEDDPCDNPDQIETVMWFFTVLGILSDEEISTELVKRRFSHDGLRRTKGARMDAIVDPNAQASSKRNAFRAILNQIALYETGVWKVNLGVDTHEPFEISNVFPPRGYWINPDDLPRIRTYFANIGRQAPSTVLTLSGIRCTIDGEKGTLRRDHKCRHREAYGLYVQDGKGWSRKHGVSVIYAHELASTLATTITNLGDRALPTVGAQRATTPEQHRLTRAIATAQANFDEVATQASALETRIDALYEHGDGDSPYARRFIAEHTALVEHNLRDAEQALANAKAALSTHNAETAARSQAVHSDALMELLARVADPYDLTFRSTLLNGITDLRFTTEQLPDQGRFSRRCRVQGTLRIGAGPHEVDVPIEGDWIQGRVRDVLERAQEAIDGMLEGRPVPRSTARNEISQRLLRAIELQLGVTDTTRIAFHCQDKRLLMVYARLLTDRTRSHTGIAKDVGVTPALVTRLASLLAADTRRQWKQTFEVRAIDHLIAQADKRGIILTSTLTATGITDAAARTAAHRYGLIPINGGYQAPACAHCGSHRRCHAIIAEPDGPVCLNCRRDDAGEYWLPDPYDRYLPYVNNPEHARHLGDSGP